MPTFSCPNCGAELAPRLKSTKLVVCDYCDSTSFLEDEAVRLAGKKGVVHDRPCLIELGRAFTYSNREFTPVGQVRFDYGLGWWDEFWAIDGGDGIWISVDEGDIAIERAVDIDQRALPWPSTIRTGSRIAIGERNYLVTERGQATCQGLRGELPEVLNPGQTFGYAHLRAGASELLTLEFDESGIQATAGEWLDPFEVRT